MINAEWGTVRKKRTMGNGLGGKKGNSEVNSYQNRSRTGQLSCHYALPQVLTGVLQGDINNYHKTH